MSQGINPLLNASSATLTGSSMSAVNAAWAPLSNHVGQSIHSMVSSASTVHFTVEKVDNGFILRSAKQIGEVAKVKIAADIDELKDLFIASLVEHRMEA